LGPQYQPIHLDRLVNEWADGVERLLPLQPVDEYGGMLLYCFVDGRPVLPDAFDEALAAVGAAVAREDIYAHVFPGSGKYPDAFWSPVPMPRTH
jgi:hypothetical protein